MRLAQLIDQPRGNGSQLGNAAVQSLAAYLAFEKKIVMPWITAG